MTENRESLSERESKRILERVSREAESGARSTVDHAVQRARDHVSDADVDQRDPIEYWGTRIGRVLGIVVAVGLIVWLTILVVKGG